MGLNNYQCYCHRFLVPSKAIVSDTSNIPQHDLGNYLGLCVFRVVTPMKQDSHKLCSRAL